MLKNILICIGPTLTIAIAFALQGCSDTQAPAKNEVSKEQKVSTTAPAQKYKSLDDFPYEVYGDAGTWSTPRLQFLWTHPDEKGSVSIWSMRLDGTDVRRVLSPKELEHLPGEKYRIINEPVRSPNNRYLAASIIDKEHTSRRRRAFVIFDLKNKTKKAYLQYSTPRCYVWTKDSKYLYMHIDELWKYDVQETSLTTEGSITFPFYGRLALIDDDTKFLYTWSFGYTLHDLEGKRIKTVRLPLGVQLKASFGHQISADGKYLKLLGRGDYYHVVLETKPPHKKIYESFNDGFDLYNTVFMPGGKQLVGRLSDGQGHALFDLKTKKITKFDEPRFHSYARLTLINYPIYREK